MYLLEIYAVRSSAFICVYDFLVYEIGVVKGKVDAVAIVADALGNDVLVREIGFN